MAALAGPATQRGAGRRKRPAPGPAADEAARPAKKQAKLPEHVPVGEEEPSKSESALPVNRKAMEAAKTKRLNEAMIRLNEAIHLINRLILLFQKPLSTADALSTACKSELVGHESKLIQPMAEFH